MQVIKLTVVGNDWYVHMGGVFDSSMYCLYMF